MATRLIDPRIKLRHITCFIEISRLKSVSAAADALSISQPAVSKTIAELEDILGTPLFDRSRRSLFLTPYGEVFLRYASTSLTALKQGIASAVSTGAEVVKIGALPTVSARILPRAVQLFTADALRARARIVTGPNAYLLSLLRTGDVDLVIGRMADPASMLGLSFEHLYSEKLALVVRPGHPLLSASAPFDLQMIETYQILMPTPDSVIRPFAQQLLIAHGISNLRDEVETVSNAFGRSFTRMTDAIWIISEGVVAEDVADGQLALLPVDTDQTLGPVGLTSRADTSHSMAAQAFMASIRTVAAQERG